MNSTELKAWISRQLGSPFLEVELLPEHYDDAIENATRWFAAEKGVYAKTVITVNAGQVEYTLPSDCDAVRDVVFSAPPFDISLVFSPLQGSADERVPYNVFMASHAGGIYSSLTQALQYVEMAKRTLGAEQDWRVEGSKIFITPKPASSGYLVVEYRSTTFQIENLSETDHNLLKEYALAAAKWTLGRIRSKYDSYPVAGGDRQLDGDKLIAEAKEEMADLKRKIHGKQYPAPILAG